jgi:hypothetical protein
VLGPGRLCFEDRQPSAAARDDRLAEELWEVSSIQICSCHDGAKAPELL